jgi:hypothetical protein
LARLLPECASMAARKRLAKAVAALATSAVIEEAVRRAAANPRVRKQAAKVGAAVRTKAKSAGKAAGQRAAALAKDANERVAKKLVGPRKAAGKKLKRLGKLVAG